MALKFKPFQSPANFKFVDPDTGYKFNAPNQATLILHIHKYRTQNNLEKIENLNIVLENYWCSLPENLGKCVEAKLGRSWWHYVRGGIAMVKNIYFKKFVDQATADARAAICVKCPLNEFPDKDGFVKFTDDFAVSCVGNRRSTYHEQLGNCGACTCVLKAKVWYGDKIELTDTERDKIISVTPNCWQLK